MLTKNTKQMIYLMQKHFDADTIRGGSYDHGDGTFCNIGCLASGKDDITYIQSEYGIPLKVMRIQEGIFEALPVAEQPQFALDCAKAIGVDGKDLSLVMPKMMVALLSRFPKQKAITTVIDLYKRVIAGDNISDMRSEFTAAAAAAYATPAADAAVASYAAATADAAVAAAAAAVYAADTAVAAAAAATYIAERQLQKEDLLRFLKEAEKTL